MSRLLLDKIGPRLRQCRNGKDLTIKELTAQLKSRYGVEILDTRYSNWEQCSRMPPLEELRILAQFFGVPSPWLAGLTDERNPTGGPCNYHAPDGFAMTRAGNVKLDQARTCLALSADCLERRGLVPDGLLLVEVEDDSMAPIIYKGDHVMVNSHARTVQSRDMFAILVNGRVWFRWIRPELDGSHTVTAEDANTYPPQTLAPGQLDNLEILGRVAFFIQSC